jgi:hypothetical protein
VFRKGLRPNWLVEAMGTAPLPESNWCDNVGSLKVGVREFFTVAPPSLTLEDMCEIVEFAEAYDLEVEVTPGSWFSDRSVTVAFWKEGASNTAQATVALEGAS